MITNSILAITRDGGATWQVLQAPTRQELIHIDVVDEKRAWIVGAAGAILHTDDAGESWIRQTSDTTVTLYHVDFRNEKKGWAVGERGTILRTDDGGRTWTKVESPARSTLLGVQFVNDDEGWIVGRGGAILRSSDAGRTWVKMSGGYRLGPQAQEYARELLRVAGPDRLVWASDCPFVGHEGQFPYKATIDWLKSIPTPRAGSTAASNSPELQPSSSTRIFRGTKNR